MFLFMRGIHLLYLSSSTGLALPARIEPEQEVKAHREKTKRLLGALAGIFAERRLFIV
jgi:hypothetical protein